MRPYTAVVHVLSVKRTYFQLLEQIKFETNHKTSKKITLIDLSNDNVITVSKTENNEYKGLINFV